jgi:hypothetical protein
MPFHPPSITAEESVDELREAAGPVDAASPAAPGQVLKGGQPKKEGSSGSRRRRLWLAVLLGILVLAAAVAAVMASLSTQSTADVVPYPTVTGVLGEHLEELQKSVEP